MKLPTYLFFSFVLLTGLFSCTREKIVKTELLSDKQILRLIHKMTLEEKISLVHGEKGNDPQGVPFVGYIPGIERLGIPEITMQNGPSGAGASFTSERHRKPATAFPVPIAQASSWNMDLLHRFGMALGSEVKAQGRTVCLAPMINMVRIPEGGRNFELFSEDPYLSAKCGVEVIKGIQKNGVLANAKALTANNQETWRFTINNIMDERSLREIYLPSFEAAVKEGQVSTIMTAYPRINGVQCSENKLLLRDILKDEWGFKGFVLTDWGTRHTTVAAANAGLDMEMSGWGKFGEPQFKYHLLNAVKDGEVSEATLDEMVYRILSELKRFGYLDGSAYTVKGELNSKEHRDLALEMAIEGAVLLKNDNNVLPLDPEQVRNIALFGDIDSAMVSGGGSSMVVPFYKVTPRQGFEQRIGKDKVLGYEEFREPAPADAAIVFLSEYSSETADRESISLADKTDLIEAVSEKYPKTIVILRHAGSYLIPWIDKVDAILQVWFPGQEEGNAEASLIFGDFNPSGKLPICYGVSREDFPASQEHEFPGINEEVRYSEGIFVGYRFFERNGSKVLFPFGHGLSYTQFSYEDLELSSDLLSGQDTLIVSYTVSNTGSREGAEVSQLYISDPESSVERPVKELKGFSKVYLKPGERKQQKLKISYRDLAFWDEEGDSWKVEPGEFRVLIGASASDIRLEQGFSYK